MKGGGGWEVRGKRGKERRNTIDEEWLRGGMTTAQTGDRSVCQPWIQASRSEWGSRHAACVVASILSRSARMRRLPNRVEKAISAGAVSLRRQLSSHR